MNNYMLLFHNDPTRFAAMSPSEIQTMLQDWAAWMGGIASKGALVSGEQLGPEGKTIKGSKKVLSDGPYSEAKEVIGGYIIVTANSFEEALEFGRGCPALEENESTVEIRQIMAR